MNKVSFISVHPDDETLGGGGTILKHEDQDDKVYCLILTKANQKITAIKDIVGKQKVCIEKVFANYNFDGWLNNIQAKIWVAQL